MGANGKTATICSENVKPMFEKNGHRGRPREDQFARRLEIYRAAAPLVLQMGARRLTMRGLAKAAHMSVGAIYHYFPTKRELLLYPLQPAVCEQMLERFAAEHGHLREAAPQQYVEAFVEVLVDGVFDLRPAVQAAFELGADCTWSLLEEGISVEMRDLVEAIVRSGGSPAHDPALLERAIRRMFLSCLLDRSVTASEVRSDLFALIRGRPLSEAIHVPVSATA